MGASAARRHGHGDQPKPGPPHLRLAAFDGVTVEAFQQVAEQAAEASGQDVAVALAFMAGALFSNLPEEQQAGLAEPAAEAGPEDVREMIQVGTMLEKAVGDFLALLRTLQKTEVPASEVRTNWADYLERVRSKDETIYITLRGKRVAALTPAYIAEQYEADQEWYWSPEWQAGEAEVEADKAAGRVTTSGTEEDFLAALGVGNE